jgi:hypothetical protein
VLGSQGQPASSGALTALHLSIIGCGGSSSNKQLRCDALQDYCGSFFLGSYERITHDSPPPLQASPVIVQGSEAHAVTREVSALQGNLSLHGSLPII